MRWLVMHACVGTKRTSSPVQMSRPKVPDAASKRGLEPQAHVDELHMAFRSLWPEFNIGNDDFIRTTEERHKKVVREFLSRTKPARSTPRTMRVGTPFESNAFLPRKISWMESAQIGRSGRIRTRA